MNRDAHSYRVIPNKPPCRAEQIIVSVAVYFPLTCLIVSALFGAGAAIYFSMRLP